MGISYILVIPFDFGDWCCAGSDALLIESEPEAPPHVFAQYAKSKNWRCALGLCIIPMNALLSAFAGAAASRNVV